MIARLKRAQQGFTLVESMVAMLIIMIGLAAMGTLTLSVMQADNLSRQRTLAGYVAEEILEEWAATDNLPTTATGSPYDFTGYTFGDPLVYTPADVDVDFTLVADVSAMSAPGPKGATINLTGVPNPQIKVVNVSWLYRGVPHQIQLTHATIFK